MATKTRIAVKYAIRYIEGYTKCIDSKKYKIIYINIRIGIRIHDMEYQTLSWT